MVKVKIEPQTINHTTNRHSKTFQHTKQHLRDDRHSKTFPHTIQHLRDTLLYDKQQVSENRPNIIIRQWFTWIWNSWIKFISSFHFMFYWRYSKTMSTVFLARMIASRWRSRVVSCMWRSRWIIAFRWWRSRLIVNGWRRSRSRCCRSLCIPVIKILIRPKYQRYSSELKAHFSVVRYLSL